ncbi:hypothetical protein HYPSUDRAFT_569128 [Hypholoma sublateritium FD-334 SS-4]|uniref:Uncharacterized protein n=1 Tax=Hypholoma sublateritium (strain FD-334 SS-4) TaxID=945553 RepID=A0A0D2L901_HYPSF|nr:hypothetical protein HYPSUDRAFT_569128 [Hypholoma sublateritium FD-334 SS-4]
MRESTSAHSSCHRRRWPRSRPHKPTPTSMLWWRVPEHAYAPLQAAGRQKEDPPTPTRMHGGAWARRSNQQASEI